MATVNKRSDQLGAGGRRWYAKYNLTELELQAVFQPSTHPLHGDFIIKLQKVPDVSNCSICSREEEEGICEILGEVDEEALAICQDAGYFFSRHRRPDITKARRKNPWYRGYRY